MNRQEKATEIDALSQDLAKAQVALIADYRGLNVDEVTKLRKALNAGKSRAWVMRNTLGRIAVKKSLKERSSDQLSKFEKVLNGPTMVMYSFEDPVAPAKVVAEFQKTNQKLVVRGAWLDGAFLDMKGVEALAKMPGKNELIAKLLSLLNAPAVQLLRVMQAPGQQVVRVIEAYRQKLEGAGQAAQ